MGFENYKGKIVTVDGEKAKVIEQSNGALTVVLQKDGKYTGGEKTIIPEGDVVLLDKRKNPKKYLRKDIRKEIETRIHDINNGKPYESGLELVKIYIKKLKDLGTDVSEYEQKIPELSKTVENYGL